MIFVEIIAVNLAVFNQQIPAAECQRDIRPALRRSTGNRNGIPDRKCTVSLRLGTLFVQINDKPVFGNLTVFALFADFRQNRANFTRQRKDTLLGFEYIFGSFFRGIGCFSVFRCTQIRPPDCGILVDVRYGKRQRICFIVCYFM